MQCCESLAPPIIPCRKAEPKARVLSPDRRDEAKQTILLCDSEAEKLRPRGLLYIVELGTTAVLLAKNGVDSVDGTFVLQGVGGYWYIVFATAMIRRFFETIVSFRP